MSDNPNQHQQPDQQSQLPPPQPGAQQAGYPAGPPQPGQPGYRPPSEGHAAAPVDEKAEAQRRDAMAATSIGAQIILDYNREGALGARGGAGGTIVENSEARDRYLVGLGLDPVSPTGPPPSREVLAARRKREEERAMEAAEGPFQSPRATRVSSLAADLGDEAQPQPQDQA